MVRSVGAVLGAALAIVVTVVVGTLAAAALLVGPDGDVTSPYVVANLVVSFAAAVLGGFIVVRTAPRRALTHAVVLGALLVLLTVPSLGDPAPGQPSWYPGALLLIAVTGVSLGALAGMRAPQGGSGSQRV